MKIGEMKAGKRVLDEPVIGPIANNGRVKK